jgi:hypothetical protein
MIGHGSEGVRLSQRCDCAVSHGLRILEPREEAAMTAVSNTMSPASTTAETKGPDAAVPARRVYASGTLRKIIFSIVFLLLLPFFVSLFPMLAARIAHGQWVGTSGLMVLALGFAFIMGLWLLS